MKKGWFCFALVAMSFVVLQVQGAITLKILNPMERIFQHEPLFGKDEAEIFAARNEVESFQVVVGAIDSNVVVHAVEFKELVGEGGSKISGNNIKLYRQEYIRVRKSTPRAELPPGLYPDPLVPFLNPETGEPIPSRYWGKDKDGKADYVGADICAVPFELWAGQNQLLWVDVHVPADAVPGVYIGALSVKSSHGLTTIPVKLTVWGFTLPAAPSHGNHLASSFRPVTKVFKVQPGSPEFIAIERNYNLLMRDHRLTPPTPGRFLPTVKDDGSLEIDAEKHAALKAFREEMHVVDFKLPRYRFAPDNAEQVTKAKRYYSQYQKYLTDNGWMDQAYVYIFDEPNSAEDYGKVAGIGKVIHEAAPGIKCLTTEQTYTSNAEWPDIDPAVDIWCPLFAFIDRNTINQKIAQGDQVWSYTALAQGAPKSHPEYEKVAGKLPPFWHTDRPLLVYRVPTWMNRQYNITGLLYWGSLISSREDPWHIPALMRNVHFNASGFMIYPGVPCEINGPVASTRLKNLRDGMEDYEYMVLLEQKAGKDAVMQFVNRVAPTWWEYTRDPEVILQVRKELAAAILEHM